MDHPRLLCLSPSFPPETTPTAIRAGKLLERLSARWDVTVLSERGAAVADSALDVRDVPARGPRRLLGLARRLRLGRLLELALWPDDHIFWVLPAIRAGRRVLREREPEAIVVFMMPYSAGLAGLALARISRLPLVLNLDDSPTCGDMHPSYPSRLHHRLAVWLEDLYLRRADAVVYVSATNLARVAERQPASVRARMRLIRYGADPESFRPATQPEGRFEILYVGAMSGWWALIGHSADGGRAARLYRALTGLAATSGLRWTSARPLRRSSHERCSACSSVTRSGAGGSVSRSGGTRTRRRWSIARWPRRTSPTWCPSTARSRTIACPG